MAMSGPYCPYEVVPLTQCRGGTEFVVSTAFGLMHCLQSDGRATGGGRGTLFVHGVHDDMNTWSAVVQAATARGIDLGPALFVDLPGFGRSENRGGRLDVSEVADTVLHVAQREAGFSSLRLVGHSMGTLVAAEMAAGAGRSARSGCGSARRARRGVTSAVVALRRSPSSASSVSSRPADRRATSGVVPQGRPQRIPLRRAVLVGDQLPGLGCLRRRGPARTGCRRPTAAGRHSARADHDSA